MGKQTFDAHEHPIMLASQPGLFDRAAAKAMRDEYAMELRRAAQKARDLGLTVPAIDLEAMAGVVDVRAAAAEAGSYYQATQRAQRRARLSQLMEVCHQVP